MWSAHPSGNKSLERFERAGDLGEHRALSDDRDTIFALSSGVGKAAVALFRISGANCGAALRLVAGRDCFPIREAVLTTLRHPRSQEPIDRAVVTRFEAPFSFTGEDMAEIGVTGGRAVIAATVGALNDVPGLRLAKPGEFAWRAFTNGKVDLSEVEGLADLVDSETEAQRRQARRIAGGALKRECAAVRASLIEAMAAVEAQIDFSDVEDAEALTDETVKRHALAAVDRIDRALSTAAAARRVREGFVVVIAGRPNVGKSSLINALAGRDVAITSAIPGTTRDLIEVSLDLNGFPVTLVDTAGLRDSDDPIEREGVARALHRARNADLTLWLYDGHESGEDQIGIEALRVRTKIDLRENRLGPTEYGVSAKTGEGIDALLDRIGRIAQEKSSSEEPPVLALERHRAAFEAARDAILSALSHGAFEAELVAEDLRHAASALDSVAGRIGVEDVLGEIFSRLCVGK